MAADLQISNARLPGHPGLWDVAITQGRISSINPAAQATPGATDLEAQGQLLIPGLVDAHIHLDKALLLERHPAQAGDFAEAMAATLQLKQGFTVADIQARARRVLESAIGLGITAMRSHVEVDPTVGLRGIKALLSLRQEYSWGITLQIAVFAQESLTQSPETLDLLRQALALGGDVVGSAPYVDTDPEGNVGQIFDLAQEFDCPVDFHLDFLDDDEPLLLPYVIAETQRRGWQGRVCLGHMTKLAGLSPEDLAALAPAIREAGISILALPASDLYMMARRDSHNVRRGVAPVHHLAAHGVNVGLATNNILNLFTPFGDGDVLKICTLLAQVLQMGTAASHQLCLEMATTQAARAMGILDYSPAGRTVIKDGIVVAQSWLERELLGMPTAGSGAEV